MSTPDNGLSIEPGGEASQAGVERPRPSASSSDGALRGAAGDGYAPPAPTGLSPQAQQWLASPGPPREYPALEDTDGWTALVADTDRQMEVFFDGAAELPAESAETEFGGVRTYVLRETSVADDPAGPLYLEMHGGALAFGSGELCRLSGVVAASTSRMPTWAVDYRMPPRHPYPAALDDCLTVYRAALDQRDPADIVVGGGSAGGNLAAATLVRAKDEGLPMPGALVLLSPEVDLTESGDSFRTHLGLDTVLRSSLMQVNRLYADGHDLAHPYLSPLFADLRGFPPTFLQTGTRDLFLSNTVRMHRVLLAAGVPVELHVFDAMPHGGFGGAPEDLEVVEATRRFLEAHRRR